MNTRRHMLAWTLAALLMSPAARGQDAVTTGPSTARYMDEQAGVTLEEAISRALEREPSLRAVRAEVVVARGLRQQAALRPNPTLSFERREEPAGTDNQTMVGVEWPLDLFRRRGRVQTADRELEATQFVATDRERLLAAEVRMQYGATVAAVRDLAVADDIVAAVRRQFELLRARVQEGVTPPLERDLLDVELRRFETERLLAAGRADAALVQLKRLLGMSPEQPLVLRDSLESLVIGQQPAVPGPATAPTALAQRPDVLEAEVRVKLGDARVEQARRDGRVDVGLFGTYMRMDAGFPQQGFGASGQLERVRGLFHYVAGGAMVILPLLNRNQGQVAAAQAERSAAAARLEAVELSARAEVAAAEARDAQAQRAVALYAGSARGLARQNLEVVAKTFELGRATVFDMLAEQRRYLEVEQAYTNALREAWDARAALKRGLGEVR
jgi:cobalt-zinc-cadmium efflux system outer membrane protein